MGEHKEFRVYDECGHDHAEGEPGVVEVWEFGLTCEDGYMYSLCEFCHTHDGECHEDSPMEQAWPCDAAKARDRVKALAAALRKYGYHLPGCDFVAAESVLPEDECSCGYRRALAGKGESDG